MIKIAKNTSNTICLTLKEKSTISSPYYLFRFISLANIGTEKAFIPIDTSSYPDRYNKFTITDSATELPYSGQMDFDPTGQWLYKIYEQSSSTNLIYQNATSLVEEGIVTVVGTTITRAKNSSTKTYKSYGTGA
jgi:hypothetical protein